MRHNSFKASLASVLHNECLRLILWVTADMIIAFEAALVKVVKMTARACDPVCTRV